MSDQTTLMIDAATLRVTGDDVGQVIAASEWTTVYFLLSGPNYILPSVTVQPRGRQPTYHTVLVPAEADPYSFAAGFLYARHEGQKVWFLSHRAPTQLPALLNMPRVEVYVIKRKKSAQDYESDSEGDGGEEEDDEELTRTPESTIMQSVKQFAGTPAGKQLLMAVLSDMTS